MQIIGRKEINKYIKLNLSKVTYEKYLIQWNIICDILKVKYIPPNDIIINRYYPRKKCK